MTPLRSAKPSNIYAAALFQDKKACDSFGLVAKLRKHKYGPFEEHGAAALAPSGGGSPWMLRGLTGRTTIYHNLLVFRRKADATETPEPERQQIPQPEYPVAAAPVRKPQPAPALPEAAAPQPPRRVSETVPAATADAEPIVKENPTGTEPPAPRTEPDRI